MNNDSKPYNSSKQIMRENISSPLNKEKARRLVLNNQKIKNDHIFDKLNFMGIPEETNDKSNNYNSNVNYINDSAVNSEGKNSKKSFLPEVITKRKINIIDLSPKDILNKNSNNIISVNKEINEEKIKNKNNFSLQLMQRNILINKSENFENLHVTNYSSSNNHIKQSANTNINIFSRNMNINLNSFGENRLSKIYKVDSFNSKKTMEKIMQRKNSSVVRRSENPEAHYANKYLSPYFETFREFFDDEKIIQDKLKEILSVLIGNKIFEKIKFNLNVWEEIIQNENHSDDKRKNKDVKVLNNENKNGKKLKLDINNKLNNLSHEFNKDFYDVETTKLNNQEKKQPKDMNINNNINNNFISSEEAKKQNANSNKSDEDIKTKTKTNSEINKHSYQNQTITDLKNITSIKINNNINEISNNASNFKLDSYTNKYSYSNNNFFGKNPIGPICEMEKIYFLCQLKNAKSEIAKISKDLVYWRLVLGDGNCFYRAFVFSLLELWILQSNLSNLEKMLCDFFFVLELEKNNCLIKQNAFNKFETGAILFLIIENIRQKNKRKAYKILIKAYHHYKSFDIGLIIYMRLVLFNYISKYKNFYYNLESQIELGHLLPNEYIDEIGNFNFEEFFCSFLLRMNSEAEKIIIYISPIIFGVDLDLFILEGLAKANYSGYDNSNCNNINKNNDKNAKEGIEQSDNLYNSEGVLIKDNINNVKNDKFINNESEIKLIKEHFPCYHDVYINAKKENSIFDAVNHNISSNNYLTEHQINNKNLEHNSSRNKNGRLHEFNCESADFDEYFNSKMLMTIKENDDLYENNNEEKEAEESTSFNKEKREISEKINVKAYNSISLLYRSAHYDKVYSKDFTEHFAHFDFKNSDDDYILNLKENLFCDRKVEMEESFCTKCDKNVKKIGFNHLSEFGFVHCQICLLTLINNLFKQRIKFFVEENYNNLECK